MKISAKHIRRAIYRSNRVYIYEKDLSEDIPAPETLLDVAWRTGTQVDIDALNVADHNYDETRKQLARAALSEGAELVIAEHNGEVAHLCWTSFKALELPGLFIPLGPGRVFMYDARTPDKFRGKHLHGAGMRVRTARAKAAGYRFAVSLADSTSPTSSHNFEREDFKLLGTIKMHRLFRKFRRTTLDPEVRAYLAGQAIRTAHSSEAVSSTQSPARRG
jgi:hypothetical protein